MNVRRITSALTLAALALVGGASAASASGDEYPAGADTRSEVRQAGKACKGVQDDGQWEACIVGMVALGTGKAMGAYVVDATLTPITDLREVGKRPSKPTKADKRALRTANRACDDMTRTNVLWEACTLGHFQVQTGRYLDESATRLYQRTDGVWVLVLKHGSQRIVDGPQDV